MARRMITWPLLGPLLWVAYLQYFIVQLVVAAAWANPYSLIGNTISDLGNTSCSSTYRSELVCSPLHTVMNVSFVLTGLLMIGGATLLFQRLRKGWAGFIGIMFSGFGSVLVGLFPENTISQLHVSGAALVFICGNLALLWFGRTLSMPRWLRYYTYLSGMVALCALVLFISGHYLGLGIGGTERFTAYPQTIWLIVFGLYQLYLRRSANGPHPA